MIFPGNDAKMFGLKCGCKLEFHLLPIQVSKLQGSSNIYGFRGKLNQAR